MSDHAYYHPYVSNTFMPYVSNTFTPYVSNAFVPYISNTFVPYVSNTFVPYVNNTSMTHVNNTSMPYVNNMYEDSFDNGTIFGIRSIVNCRFDSSEKHLIWCESGKFGYYSDNGEFRYMLNQSKFAFSEMISEESFIFVYVGKLTQFVLYVNGNVRKTIETSEPIVGLRFHSNMLAVIQLHHILVYRYNENDISTLDKITYYTDPNPLGWCEFKNKVIVFPETKEIGVLRIINTQDNTEKKLQLQQSKEIACLALSQSGDLLAVSFVDIPVIYIWSIVKDKQIFILQTYTTHELFHINFSADSKLACCSTTNGEINIFNTDISEHDVDNTDFRTKKIKGFNNFMIPLWQPCKCKFLTDNTIQVICKSDKFYPFTYPVRMTNPSRLPVSIP